MFEIHLDDRLDMAGHLFHRGKRRGDEIVEMRERAPDVPLDQRAEQPGLAAETIMDQRRIELRPRRDVGKGDGDRIALDHQRTGRVQQDVARVAPAPSRRRAALAPTRGRRAPVVRRRHLLARHRWHPLLSRAVLYGDPSSLQLCPVRSHWQACRTGAAYRAASASIRMIPEKSSPPRPASVKAVYSSVARVPIGTSACASAAAAIASFRSFSISAPANPP